jgi:hypothetical protein
VTRPVSLSREDILAIEKAAEAQIAHGGVKEGFYLLSRCLSWRFDAGISGEPFRCHIDESAGLAEVVELHQHSRRVDAC